MAMKIELKMFRNKDFMMENGQHSSKNNPTCTAALLEDNNTLAIVKSSNSENTSHLEASKRNEEEILNRNQNNEFTATPRLLPQVLAALTAAWLQLGMGVSVGYTGIVLPSLTNPNSTDVYLTMEQSATFTSSVWVGIFIGSIPAGFLANKIGQRITVMLTIPLGICGWIILGFAKSFTWLSISRILIGILNGMALAASVTYIVEVAHSSVRARLLATLDLFRQFGFTFVSVIGSIGIHWRTVGLICGLISYVPPLIIFAFLPNSPRWLAARGRKDESRSSLQYFRGSHYNINSELDDIFDKLDNSSNSKRTLYQLKLLLKGVTLRRFCVLVIIMIFGSFVGNLIMSTYSTTIFKAANSNIDEYMSTILSTVMRILGTATYIALANKINRKTLLIGSLFISGLCLITFGTYFYMLFNHYDMRNATWIPLVATMIHLYCAGIFGPVVMLLTGELLPTTVRAIGNGIIVYYFQWQPMYLFYHFLIFLNHLATTGHSGYTHVTHFSLF